MSTVAWKYRQPVDLGVVKLVALSVIVLAMGALAVSVGVGFRRAIRSRRLSRRGRLGLLAQAWVLGVLSVALAVVLVLIFVP